MRTHLKVVFAVLCSIIQIPSPPGRLTVKPTVHAEGDNIGQTQPRYAYCATFAVGSNDDYLSDTFEVSDDSLDSQLKIARAFRSWLEHWMDTHGISHADGISLPDCPSFNTNKRAEDIRADRIDEDKKSHVKTIEVPWEYRGE